jgi:hypothetical protein
MVLGEEDRHRDGREIGLDWQRFEIVARPIAAEASEISKEAIAIPIQVRNKPSAWITRSSSRYRQT